MQQKVQTYIQKHQLLTSNKPVIVGVSGGTDSVVLLHLLISLEYNCIIAHCNFHLRTEESDRDETFVRNLASFYKLPFYCVDFQTTTHAKELGISIEMAARELRYNWFAELLEKHNAQAIAVAHHADDSIETLLLNLVRGTGLRGMTGIAPRNKNVVRPLLCCMRSELENYLVKHGLEHVEDSTNALSDYKRNKIRNEVIPLLEEINPSIKQTLHTSIDYFNGTLAIYQQAISTILNQIVEKSDYIVKMNINVINEQVHIPTIMYELLYPYGFHPATIEQVTEHLNAESGKVFYSETHRLIKDRNFLIISEKGIIIDSEYFISHTETILNIPFTLRINRFSINSDFKPSKDANSIHIDASLVSFPLQIRRWREGDFFYPFGMKQRKKVSDFFIDNKLSLIEKEQVWLLVSDNEIVWIVGLRMDNRFRVTEKTNEVIEFCI